MATNHPDRTYVTLVTKPSYVIGAIVLAYSLSQCKSEYPLLVLVTPGLGVKWIQALEFEAKKNPTINVQLIEPLVPREGLTGSAAARFADTYTKLRAFQLHEQGYKKCVFLDADMAVFQTPDELFDVKLPDKTWIAANHACVCNLDFDSFAPADWNKGNCAYTPLNGPHDPPTRVTPDARPTYHLLNSGMFVYEPHKELWDAMMYEFETSDKVKSYGFPDQDFMKDFFHNRWQSLSWKFNALKTMRSWHPRMYRDEDVVVLHYIVDKPWDRRIADDKIAGHLGRDGHTHQQWWNIYEHWETTRKNSKDKEAETVVKYIREQVPRAPTGDANMQQIRENMKFTTPDGNKVAIKPFGTPPGELSDVSEYAPGDKQTHPYEHFFPPNPSESLQQFDEAAGLALESLFRKPSLVSNDSLTEAEMGEPLTPEADPGQYADAALLFWFRRAQVMDEEVQNLKDMMKLLEAENLRLHAELGPTRAAKRHKLPPLKMPKPVFFVGSSAESSPEKDPEAIYRWGQGDLGDIDQQSSTSRPGSPLRFYTNTRKRWLKSASSQPSSPESRDRFHRQRLAWAADPDEVDSIPIEERVDNILGHTRQLSGRAGQLSPLAESPGSLVPQVGSLHIPIAAKPRINITNYENRDSSSDGSHRLLTSQGTTTPLPFAWSPGTDKELADRFLFEGGEREDAGPSSRTRSKMVSNTALTVAGATSRLQACATEDTMEGSTERVSTGGDERKDETVEEDDGPSADLLVAPEGEDAVVSVSRVKPRRSLRGTRARPNTGDTGEH